MKIEISKKTTNGNIYLIALLLSLGLFLVLPALVLLLVVFVGGNINPNIALYVLEYTQTQVVSEEMYILNIVADTIAKTVLSIVIIIIFLKSFKYDFKEFGDNWKKYLKIIAIASIAMFVGNIIVSLIFQAFGLEGDSENQYLIELVLSGDGKYFMIFETILVAPIIEELIFRKFLIGTLEEKCSLNPLIAVCIATLVFSLIHVVGGDLANYIYIFQYIPLAFIISYSYYKSNYNILVPMIIHLINNTLSIVMFYLALGGVIK